MRLLQAELGVQISVHLDVHIGARGARPQLMHPAHARIGGHAADDLGPVAIGQLMVEQLVGRIAEHLDRAPDQPAGHHQARCGIGARFMQHGGQGDADDRGDIG